MKKQNSPFRQYLIEQVANDLIKMVNETLTDELGKDIQKFLPDEMYQEILITGAIESLDLFQNKLYEVPKYLALKPQLQDVYNDLKQHLQNKLIIIQCTVKNN